MDKIELTIPFSSNIVLREEVTSANKDRLNQLVQQAVKIPLPLPSIDKVNKDVEAVILGFLSTSERGVYRRYRKFAPVEVILDKIDAINKKDHPLSVLGSPQQIREILKVHGDLIVIESLTVSFENSDFCNFLKHIKHLIIEDFPGGLTEEAFRDFFSKLPESLTSLDISWNSIGLTGAIALAQSANMKNLTSLNMTNTYIGDGGLQALLESPHIRNLRNLYLAQNRLSHQGAMAIAASLNLGQLTCLILDQNDIEDVGVIAIAESSNLHHLIKLSISHNKITTVGAMAILNSVYRAHLTSLDVSFNNIEDEFALAILQNRGNIEELNVDSTYITLDSRRALRAIGYHAEHASSHASLHVSFSEGEGDPF